MIEDIPTVPIAPEGSATISALAALWGLTKGTIRNYIDCGDLQAVRVPNEGGYSFTIHVVNPPTLKPHKPRGNPALFKPAEPEAPKRAKGKAAKPSGRKIAPLVESEPAIRPSDIGEALALLKTGVTVPVGLPVEDAIREVEVFRRWEDAIKERAHQLVHGKPEPMFVPSGSIMDAIAKGSKAVYDETLQRVHDRQVREADAVKAYLEAKPEQPKEEAKPETDEWENWQ